jgi:branched-chain amino acid transport system ATP-binding protein
VTEDRAIIRRLTVMENLKLCSGEPEASFDIFPELRALRNRRAGLLSGGEQQMLALGKLLMSRPSVLLIDELSLGLAPVVVERLLEAVKAAATQGAGVLLVEQQATTALTVADRAYVLSGGEMRLSGHASDLLGQIGEIERIYLTG